MRRRSTAGGKTAAGKRRSKSNTARPHASTIDSAQTDIAELERELEQAREQQVATADVLKVISRSPRDVQPVFDMIAASARQLCEGQFCFVYRFDGQLLHFVAHHSLTPEVLEMNRRAYPAPPSRRSAAARAILERGFVQIPDINADPDYVLGAQAMVGHYRSVVGVPILRDGVPIGAIAVARAPAGLLPDRQIELLKTFADQAVIAIENVRLFNELQARTRELSESLEQQTATSEILEVISNSPTDTQPAFDAIVRSGLNLFPDAVVTISLPDRGSIKLGAIGGTDKAGVEALRGRFPMPLSREFITGTAILDRREIDIADAHEPPKELRAGAKNLLAGGYRAMTVMPMVRGDETIGTLNVVRRNPGPLSDKQRELLRTFANQAVIAIENTRLFNELRESLQQQTATADILATISSSQAQLKPVFETIVDRTTRICGATFACLGLFEGEALRFASISGASADSDFFHSERLHQPGGCPYVVPLARAKKTVQTPDLRAEKGYLERDPFYVTTVDVGGARTALRVPLLKDGKLLGHLWAFRQEVRPFADKQVELIKNFAAQAV